MEESVYICYIEEGKEGKGGEFVAISLVSKNRFDRVSEAFHWVDCNRFADVRVVELYPCMSRVCVRG